MAPRAPDPERLRRDLMMRTMKTTAAVLLSLAAIMFGGVMKCAAAHENMRGVVMDTDPENRSLTLGVKDMGSINVQLADDAEITSLKKMKFSDLADGDRVVIFGWISDDQASVEVGNMRRIPSDDKLRPRITMPRAIHGGVIQKTDDGVQVVVGDKTVKISNVPTNVSDVVDVAFEDTRMGQDAVVVGDKTDEGFLAVSLLVWGRGGKGALATAPYEGKPGLPNVMIIGDSISIGYTMPLRDALEGKANVYRPLGNCLDTNFGLEHLDEWLGDRKWDVIHFNWGLHDVKYMKGRKLDFSGERVTPLDKYEANLRQLVERMKATGAKLIWATTTPVPKDAEGRRPEDVVPMNEVAARVMKDMGVDTDDLYSAILPRHEELMKAPGNVHYTAEGYQFLAEQVAKSIEAHLP